MDNLFQEKLIFEITKEEIQELNQEYARELLPPTLLKDISSLSKEDFTKQLLTAYTQNVAQQNQANHTFSQKVSTLCQKKMEEGLRTLSRWEDPSCFSEPLYVFGADPTLYFSTPEKGDAWKVDLLSSNTFQQGIVKDPNGPFPGYRRLTYHPEKRLFHYTENRAGRTYNAYLLPASLLKEVNLDFELLDKIEPLMHVPKDNSIPGFPDMDYSVKEWYQAAYPQDEIGEEVQDVSFSHLLNTINQGKIDEAYAIMGDDSMVRERCFSELSRRLSVPYEEIYSAWLDEHPIGNRSDCFTLDEILQHKLPIPVTMLNERVNRDTSLKDWYQKVSMQPLAGIGMQDMTVGDFLDHISEHPNETYFTMHPKAQKAALSIAAKVAKEPVQTLEAAWNGLTRLPKDSSREEQAFTRLDNLVNYPWEGEPPTPLEDLYLKAAQPHYDATVFSSKTPQSNAALLTNVIKEKELDAKILSDLLAAKIPKEIALKAIQAASPQYAYQPPEKQAHYLKQVLANSAKLKHVR